MASLRRRFVRSVSSSFGATGTMSVLFRLSGLTGCCLVRGGATIRIVSTFAGRFRALFSMLNLSLRRAGTSLLSRRVRRLVRRERRTEGRHGFRLTSGVHSRLGRVGVVLRSAPRKVE